MKSVHVLTHQYERLDVEEAKLIGVYSSKKSAEEAIERLKDKEGFRDHVDGFCIDEYPIDKDHWTEGFFTYRG